MTTDRAVTADGLADDLHPGRRPLPAPLVALLGALLTAAVVVAFPDRRVGTGLYAFVEGNPGLSERGLREFLAAETADKAAPKSPEHLQLTGALPRTAAGEVRSEILDLVAMNQVDLIDSLIANDDERSLVARIVADRRNLRDRFAF